MSAQGKYARFNKSRHDKGTVERTYLVVQNNSPQQISCIWLDFQGKPKLYRRVQPGQRFVVYTFNTHPWVIEDDEGAIWASYMGLSAVLTINSRTKSSLEQILDVAEGCKHPIWGAAFAKHFNAEPPAAAKQPARVTPEERQARREKRQARRQAREAKAAKRQERREARKAARAARQGSGAAVASVPGKAQKGVESLPSQDKEGEALPEELQMWCEVSESETEEAPRKLAWYNPARLCA